MDKRTQWLGNDAADELTKRGSDSIPMGPEPFVPLPYNQIQTWIRQRTTRLHQKYWSNRTDCRQSREALPSISQRLSRQILNLKRIHLRLVVGAFTGHCHLNKHLFTLGITDSPLCRGCMEAEETAAHVLLECSAVTTQRATILGSPGTLPEACQDVKRLVGFLVELGWLE